ncbi:MAG: nucleoside deaminase [Bacteroidaceae bacterium]|nr:nucleoside deaminase [Bacteroidaceae bacterium]
MEKEILSEDLGYLRMAAELSEENVDNGGGPFGAVVVRDGEVLATGVNRVTANNDPTAHAEVMAVRAACARVGAFSLRGATVYSSCEPCPMCLSALYWAGVERVVYGNTQADADAIGFSDEFLYKELAKPQTERSLRCVHLANGFTIRAFRKWGEKEDKVAY